MRSRLAVEEQQRQRACELRERDQDQDRIDVDRPDEERQPHPAHAGRPQVVDRDDEVDRAENRRDRRQMEREDPEVLAVARLESALGQRRGRVPARARSAAAREPARVEDDPAEQVEPVRGRVQAREGHVAGADHQRHEVVREAGEDRHDDEEDHRRPVHREHLVVGVAREDVLVGPRELRAHQERDDPAGDEEDQAREDVHDPDPLVVDRREPAGEAAARDDRCGWIGRDPNRHRWSRRSA